MLKVYVDIVKRRTSLLCGRLAKKLLILFLLTEYGCYNAYGDNNCKSNTADNIYCRVVLNACVAPTTVLAPISSAKQVIPSNIDIAAAVTAEVNFFIISIIPFFFLQRLLYYISSEKASGKLYKFFQSSAKFIL